MGISEDVSEMLETTRCCSACSHDGSFVIWIASWNVLVVAWECALALGMCLCCRGRISGVGMRQSLGTMHQLG